jgi:putative FmdB family regulatory protein
VTVEGYLPPAPLRRNIQGHSSEDPVPTYEYECEKCRRRFSVVHHISAHTGRAPACPKCKSKSTRQLPSAFYAKTIKKS